MIFLKERTEKNDQFQKWSKRKKKQMRNCWSNKETLSCVFEDQHTSNLSILKITKVNTKKKKLKKMDLIVANNHDELSNFRNSGRQISTLQQKFQDRLASSKFRKLNEELYSSDSSLSWKRFTHNPDLFHFYHKGYRSQIRFWPVNPLDIIYSLILKMQQQSSTVPIWKTKGILNPKLTIADFGCGDATLAERLLSVQSSYNQCTYKNKAYGSKDMTRKKRL